MQNRPTVRAPTKGFHPRYRLDAQVHERLRRIERLDHDLALLQAGDEAHAMLRAALSYNAYGTASIEGSPLTLDEVESA